MELLEETNEMRLEEIELERTQMVGHSTLQAIGTGVYNGEEYQVTASDTGDRIAVRASSENEVYSGNLDKSFDDEYLLRTNFEEIVEETDLDLAYSNN